MGVRRGSRFINQFRLFWQGDYVISNFSKTVSMDGWQEESPCLGFVKMAKTSRPLADLEGQARRAFAELFFKRPMVVKVGAGNGCRMGMERSNVCLLLMNSTG